MAIYGRGQMLGSGINPESFKQDYSGFANAAAIRAQGLSNLGASIGGAIKDFGEVKKEQKKVDAYNKASAKAIEAAITLGGSYEITGAEKTLRPFLEAYNDPNLSPIEKAALLDEGKAMIPNVFGRFDQSETIGIKEKELGIEEERYNQAAKIRQAEIEAEARKRGPVTEIAAPGGGTQQMERNPITGVFEPIKVGGVTDTSQTVKGNDLIDLVKGFEGFNPKAYNDYKQTSIGYGTKGKPGEVLTEEQATERLQTELSGHAKRIQEAAELKGIALNQNQFNALTSFDYNTGRGANLVERFGDNPQQLASKILEYTKAGGKDLPGLVKRRQIEAALFLAPEEQAVENPQVTSQNQNRFGFTEPKPKTTSRIITGDEAVRLGGDPEKKYIIKESGDEVSEMTAIPPDITPAEERQRAKDEDEKAETKRAGELTVKSINKFINKEGKYNEYLDKAVGYGEEFATGVAKYVPFLGTQSAKDRANQKELKILVETGILEAASLLKPVSNVDLLLLKGNRPEITDPPELWAGWLKKVRDILDDPNSYAESSTPLTPEAPQSATDRLRAKASQRR
jgi:GH24 family phage-related lysozyme (muramidase)